MVGRTNAGSGSGRLTAIIAVTYPEGSVCTVTNGTKTYKAKDTSGNALFNVAVGSWTVSCTDGENTASKEINVEANTSAVIELSYRFYLFKSGEGIIYPLADFTTTGNYVTVTDDSITQSSNKGTSSIIFSSIDTTDFTALYADVDTSVSTNNYGFNMSFSTGNLNVNNSNYWKAGATLAAKQDRQIISCDITNLNGEYYPGIGSNTGGFILYNLWLE